MPRDKEQKWANSRSVEIKGSKKGAEEGNRERFEEKRKSRRRKIALVLTIFAD